MFHASNVLTKGGEVISVVHLAGPTFVKVFHSETYMNWLDLAVLGTRIYIRGKKVKQRTTYLNPNLHETNTWYHGYLFYQQKHFQDRTLWEEICWSCQSLKGQPWRDVWLFCRRGSTPGAHWERVRWNYQTASGCYGTCWSDAVSVLSPEQPFLYQPRVKPVS